jgi:hypothetical protein
VIDHNGRIHNQVVDLLSAYIDGELSAGERELVQAHITTCSTCADDLASLRQTVRLLGQLPQVAAPRPFTLRESDVRPIGPTARRAWWQVPWTQRLVAAAAMFLCVLVVGGVLLMSRRGMVGAPAEPESIALQALSATNTSAPKMAAEQAAVATVEIEKEVEREVAVVEAETEKVGEADEAIEAPAAAEEVTLGQEMLQKAPSEEVPTEGRSAADEAQILPTTTPPQPAVGAAPALTATPMPAATPAPDLEAMTMVSPTTLLEVEDLILEIEPGLIHVSGRLSLPEGRKLLADLWRNEHPTAWSIPENPPVVMAADGRFSLDLQAQPQAPDFDLFAIPPADYQIRIRPVDPPEPVEARIPFDTYGPPPAAPTQSP